MTRTVLITGVSGGAGRAVAQRFRTQGATVLPDRAWDRFVPMVAPTPTA